MNRGFVVSVVNAWHQRLSALSNLFFKKLDILLGHGDGYFSVELAVDVAVRATHSDDNG